MKSPLSLRNMKIRQKGWVDLKIKTKQDIVLKWEENGIAGGQASHKWLLKLDESQINIQRKGNSWKKYWAHRFTPIRK